MALPESGGGRREATGEARASGRRHRRAQRSGAPRSEAKGLPPTAAGLAGSAARIRLPGAATSNAAAHKRGVRQAGAVRRRPKRQRSSPKAETGTGSAEPARQRRRRRARSPGRRTAIKSRGAPLRAARRSGERAGLGASRRYAASQASKCATRGYNKRANPGGMRSMSASVRSAFPRAFAIAVGRRGVKVLQKQASVGGFRHSALGLFNAIEPFADWRLSD